MKTAVRNIVVGSLALIIYLPLVAQIHVDAAGEVGIGTNTPNTDLHVSDGASGVSGGTYPRLIRAESSGDTGFLISTPQAAVARIYHSTPFDNASAGIAFDGNSRFMTFFTSNGTERMRITSDGKIGVGTASPTGMFHVNEGDAGVAGGYYTFHSRVESDGDTGFLMSTPRQATAYLYHSTPLDGGSSGIRFDGDSRFMAFFVKNGIERMRIDRDGDVGIGTTNPTYPLHVNGSVRATSFIANTNTYADFVFEDEYLLPTLESVEAHIEEFGHLPGIPSEAEATANGINLAEMQVKLLQKIEEITLHQIAQEKRLKHLEKENAELRSRLD